MGNIDLDRNFFCTMIPGLDCKVTLEELLVGTECDL
jgi:hypothetical protein